MDAHTRTPLRYACDRDDNAKRGIAQTVKGSEMLDWLASLKASAISHFFIGFVAACVPVVMRQGLSPRQAFVMVLAGALGASVFARPIALWLDPYLAGTYDDIVQGVAFSIGLFAMRVAEEVIRFIERRAQRFLDSRLGIRRRSSDDSGD